MKKTSRTSRLSKKEKSHIFAKRFVLFLIVLNIILTNSNYNVAFLAFILPFIIRFL